MKLRNWIFLLFPFLILLVILHACKKDSTITNGPGAAPTNPYGNINRGDTSTTKIAVDSLTITYVHQKVFQPRCAINGCHDGHFEPDYRTPMSSFATLVYAPINKNDTANRYKFSVIPNDTTKSVLYQRITNCCFVNKNDRMPQDNIGVPLPDSSINLVARWIMHGARDMFGNLPTRPDEPPIVEGIFAISTNYQTVYSTNRLDSIYYNPFIVPASATSFIVAVGDTDDITPTSQLKVNTLKFSLKATDFSNATSLQTTYINSNGQFWITTVNASSFAVGDTVYMRYYVNDGNHASNTEFPNNSLPSAYFTYFSFIRQ